MRVDLDNFEQQYRAASDPWDFATSSYEQHRYDVIVEALGTRHYQRCFEPGCSVGILTERLAGRADTVVAMDTSATALATAATRLERFDAVRLMHGAIPEDWPKGRFDLIVFAELGYYWDADELRTLATLLDETTVPGGDIVAVHWLGQSGDHLLGGAEVHEILGCVLGTPAEHRAEPGFVLDRWRRCAE